MEEISQDILDKAHQALFKMLCEVDSIFKKHHVRYCISFGTLLGALRHKGFIPWDDDIDLHVFSEDYEKAVKVLREELNPKRFILHDKVSDPHYWCTFARVKDLNSQVVYIEDEKEDDFKYKGLHVSLLHAPKTKRNNRFFYKLLKELKNSYYYNKQQKSISCFLKYLISATLIPFVKIVFKINELLPGTEIRIFGNMAWSGQFYSDSEILPFTELEFCGRMFPVAKNHKQVLQDAYGATYMTLPPIHKREIHFKEITFKEI